MPQNFVKDNVAYHETLNPQTWDNDRLRPEVAKRLLEIAKVFINYLDIPNFKVKDVILAGSMANYNYTKYSDFDIHVVTNYSDLQCDDIAEAFYRAKKQIWNDKHDITIYGHEAELYVEDEKSPPVSGGMYSILKDEWINIPEYAPPRINDRAINLKVNDLIKQIDVAINDADDPEDIDRLRTKIRKMRQSGLASGGEFGVENLAFKILRNLGYLDMLSDEYTKQQDVNLSLNEDAQSHRAREFSHVINQYYSKVGLPIKITKHFVERMSDPRNGDTITAAEIADFFAKMLKRRKQILASLAPEETIQVYDSESDITVPLIKTEDMLVATTIMRGEMRRGSSDLIVL
ncbi:Polymerase, nucleotidyl transferase domain containing protein [uncultured Caudovirales phage]|uniref:Polymerase, nucleotidyl transferase domain containing protein n=1 Tax=uncultured Caudovirales phage TaxID=2100421 RepID=A0A6J5LH47_9CAUD|nr:Polymerase, nucleotidyl transferase domain containing protein [uncultured Caudovirales phage]